MTAKPAEWYDAALDDPASPHLRPNPVSPWHELYTAVARILHADPEPAYVIDLGCGTGRLAALIDPARGTTRSYVGVDFSQAMVAEAIRYTHERCAASRCAFGVSDVRTIAVRYGLLDPHATYLLIELLEHLDDDLALLRTLPADARLIISVPSTDSESHVRHFPTIFDALERYADTIEIETWERIWTPERQGFWHLMTATRRER